MLRSVTAASSAAPRRRAQSPPTHSARLSPYFPRMNMQLSQTRLLSPCALHRPPDLLRRQRRIEMAHSEASQCIQHRIGYRRRRGDRGDRPYSLRPERVSRRWHLQRLQDEGWDLMGLGEGIVQQAPRQRLTLRAVDDVFGQGLPETLGDATDNLSFDQARVDDAATVVDANVAHDGDLACLTAHLHDHSMGAKGEGGPRQGVGTTKNQPALCLHRPRRLARGSSHELCEGQLVLWLVAIACAAFLETDVGSRTGEQL